MLLSKVIELVLAVHWERCSLSSGDADDWQGTWELAQRLELDGVVDAEPEGETANAI